jgi:hypothetical protein
MWRGIRMREPTAQEILDYCDYWDLTVCYYLDFTGNKILVEKREYGDKN